MVDLTRRRLFTKKTNQTDSGLNHLLPWLKDAHLLTEQCTRCQHCLSACETNIIIKGDGGFPTVDFSIDECTFCYQCATSCPEDLFRPKSEAPWHISATTNTHCLANNNVECRSCQDICEPLAIQFTLKSGQVAQPQFSSELCSGCGACVSICPTQAIQIIQK